MVNPLLTEYGLAWSCAHEIPGLVIPRRGNRALPGRLGDRSLDGMGYQTAFIGYLEIEPPLGPRERSLINRISGSLLPRDTDTGLRVADADDEVLRDLLSQAPRGWSNWGGSVPGLLSELRRR